MEDEKIYVQPIKNRLNEYREREREIECLTEALEVLQGRLDGLGAKNITDMPRSPSPSNDRIIDLMQRKLELEDELRLTKELQHSERNAIKRAMNGLKSANEKGVIRFRYLLCMEWDDVTFSLYGTKDDYVGKEDSYQRTVFNLNGKAILNMAIYMQQQGV